MLARPCRFDCGVQCEQVRLIRDSADRPRDLADVLCSPLELRDGGDGGQLPLGIALDRANRRVDLRRASANVTIRASERRPAFSASPRLGRGGGDSRFFD
jgi:hypothetical protein